MDVRPGSRLGNYEVIELIGEGGMGSVYRANDTQLGRQVAVKVVRAQFTEDPDRVARFSREARLLASLSHPNIATIHGFEESSGVRFLVLELVPGATLAERLARGPLPVREALGLAAQIAGAIEAAHDGGVIHRDLKPANIKIAPDGRVKVLDFGLAKAFAPEPGAPINAEAATRAASGTGAGMVLGTPTYMSPEQASGEEVDKRTDIWAFGCVLYDMLTGKTAFGCETRSDTIAAILTRDPDWSRIPADLPSSIRCLLRRALDKDPKRRLRDAGDARIEIEDAIAARHEASGVSSGGPGSGRTGRRNRIELAAGAITLAAISAAGAWMLKPTASQANRPAVQFTLALPAGEHLDGLDYPAVVLSPVETHVAYVASRGGPPRLFVHALSALDGQPIEDTEGALSPFFSPDGEWIGFFADGKLKKVRVTGGAVTTLCDASIGFGGAWDQGGTIVYAPGNGSALWQVPADGGTPHPVTKLDTARGEFSHRWPELIPGVDAVLYTAGTEGSWDDAEIVVQSLKSGVRHTVLRGGTNPKYLAGSSLLLYARGGSVFAVSFDAGSGKTTAGATPVLSGVLESSDGAIQLSASRAGSLAYLTGDAEVAARRLVWMDRQGNMQPLAAPPRAYSSPRLAPDGLALAVTITGAERDEVWTYNIAQNALAQVTFEGGGSPVWSSDASRIIFSASRDGPPAVFWRHRDGSGADERLTRSPRAHVPNSASPDGRTLALVEYDPAAGRHILLLNVDDRALRPFLGSAVNEKAPAFSPDGRWVAYVSDESGRDQVYIAAAGDPKRRATVSTDGGSEPVWRRDGAELFFRSANGMMAAAVATRPNLVVRPARLLFEGVFDTGGASRPAYDVSADGTRFLMVTRRESERPQHELRVYLGAITRLPAGR